MKIIKFLQTIFVANCVMFGTVSSAQANGEEELAKVNQSISKKDYKTAFKYLNKATKKGNVEAEFLLGIFYSEGIGVKKDFKKGTALIFNSCMEKKYQEACKYIDSRMAATCSNGSKEACNAPKFAK